MSYRCSPYSGFYWSKVKITKADTPTIRMDWHSIPTNRCPNFCHPHHFYVGCPSWHNPPYLSWLGTGTKYAGLHIRPLGRRYKKRHSIFHSFLVKNVSWTTLILTGSIVKQSSSSRQQQKIRNTTLTTVITPDPAPLSHWSTLKSHTGNTLSAN